MALDDYADSEIAIAVAATAVVFSPRIRRYLRKGAVYGLAGVLMASDAVSGFARGAAQGVRQVAESAGDEGAASEGGTGEATPASGGD